MSDDLVTLATYPSVAEAEMFKVLLEEEGIAAVVDEIDSAYGPLLGYLPKLKVVQSSVDRAQKILENSVEKHRQRSLNPTMSEPETCLECGTSLDGESTVCPKCDWSFLSAVEGQPSPDDERIEL